MTDALALAQARIRDLEIRLAMAEFQVAADKKESTYEHVGYCQLSKEFDDNFKIVDKLSELAITMPTERISELLGDKRRLALRVYIRHDPISAIKEKNNG